jgi:hypothetical protein
MPAPAQLACLTCGYDLSGIESPQCPECGCVDPASPLSPRAVWWSRRERLWLGVPVGVFSLLLLAWCLLLEPATGHGLTDLGSFVGAYAGILFGVLLVHAIAWAATSGDSEVARLRGRLWWLTLPILHAWWLLWPVVVLVGLRFASMIGVGDRSAAFAFFGLLPIGIAALMPVPVWRVGWWITNKLLGTTVRPSRGVWAATAVIGVQASVLFVVIVAALAMIGV